MKVFFTSISGIINKLMKDVIVVIIFLSCEFVCV